jgi:hypothetical protein
MARADSRDAAGELSGAQRSASARTTAPSVTARLQTSLFYSRPTAVAAPRPPSHPMAMQFLHSFKWAFAVALQAGSARSMAPAAIAGSIAPSGGGRQAPHSQGCWEQGCTSRTSTHDTRPAAVRRRSRAHPHKSASATSAQPGDPAASRVRCSSTGTSSRHLTPLPIV